MTKSKKTTNKQRLSTRSVLTPELTDDEINRLIDTGVKREIIYPQMYSEMVQVSPKQAKEWLENNFNRNRDIVWSRVIFFKNLAAKGKMKSIAQGITFSRFGDLMDGQHRLHGIIEAGVTVNLWVTYGEDPANFYLYDDHRPRSVGDILTTLGVRDGKNIAAIYKKVLDLVKTSPTGYSALGHRKWAEYNKGSAIAWARDEENLTVLEEISTYLQSKKDLAELRTAPSILGALYYMFWQYNPNLAREFFGRLRDGANLSTTSPILWARKTLMVLRDDFKRKYWQSPPQFVYPAVIIRAWNDWVNNRQANKKYPIQTSGMKFPIIDTPSKVKQAS